MQKYYLLVILFLSSYCSFAQEQPDYMHVADKAFNKYEYSFAEPIYAKMATRKRVPVDILYKLAVCYDKMQQYQKAVTTYKAYLERDSSAKADVWLRVGDILKILQRYDEAKTFYAQFQEKNQDKSIDVGNRIAGCDSAVKWERGPDYFSLSNQYNWNTANSDWGATYYDDKVVFTSDGQDKAVLERRSKVKINRKYGWTGNSFLKLFSADPRWGDVPDTTAGDSVLLGDFGSFANRSKYHVGPAAFSLHYDTVYFTITNKSDALEKSRLTRRISLNQYNLELYMSYKETDGSWHKPIGFAYNSPKEFSVGHAALSHDGSVLYFSSDMPGGFGKTDIWYCEKSSDGTWGTPKNCGAVINTPEEEEFATFGPDKELFFASTGHPGMGGFDIFRARGKRDQWQKPENLHTPFNSSYDDFYLSTLDNKSGYICSNRPEGKGSDDIYSFHPFVAPPPELVKARRIVLKTILVNAHDSSRIEGGIIELTNLDRKIDRIWTGFSGVRGVNYFVIEFDKHYYLRGAHIGFSRDSTHFETTAPNQPDTVVEYLYLLPCEDVYKLVKNATPYKVGDVFVLEDLYYDFDKYNIRPDAAKILDNLVATLQKYPTLEIELSSHTDSRGSDNYNLTLSQHRAESAVRYVVSRGIASHRIIARGYGETKLRNKCSNGVECSPAEHQLNRRTEVRIQKT